MHKTFSYRTLLMGLRVGLGLAICVGASRAQEAPKTPTQQDLYCTAVATDQAVPKDTYVISGEDSHLKDTFHPGDLVYINRGAEQGVKVGDQFEVTRAVNELMPTNHVV